MTNVTEFLRESRRIDQLIWDAMALVAEERVLFCSFANDGEWVRRAVEVGVAVTVIDSNPQRLEELNTLGIKTLRGSTTMIPARDESFDAVVAFHYLHEIDPTFHAQTVFELARVAKRIVVVEPAPPTDLLGRRIAELYSRAKFEAGAFEEYQPIEYWRKLLAIVKADVMVQQFTFARVAPRFLIEDTVELLLDAMAISDLPEGYLEELRGLARNTDTQLSPLSRYVLVGFPGGEEPRKNAGTLFRPEPELAVTAPAPAEAPAAAVARVLVNAAAASAGTSLEGAEFPPVLGPGGTPIAPAAGPPPAAAPAAPDAAAPVPAVPAASPAQAQPAPAAPPGPAAAPAQFGPPPTPAPAVAPGRPAPVEDEPDEEPFGLPSRGSSPKPARLGTPFALPEDPDPFGLEEDPARRPGTGWSWEPPEPDDEEFGPPPR